MENSVKTYHGACHCRTIQFDIVTNLDHVRVCDCSICQRRGALIHRIPRSALTYHSDWQKLSIYTWGSLTAKDYFCSNCGILVFREPSKLLDDDSKESAEEFDGWAINVRCLDDVDIDTIPIQKVFGSKIKIDLKSR